MTAPEFSRPERIDSIGADVRELTVAADAGERAALAARFAMLAVDALEAHFRVRREGADILVEGAVTARVVQACAMTGEPVPAAIAEPIALRFVVPGAGEADELELAAGDLDVVELDGGAIDLGETAAETMALALDPFPRCAAADAERRVAGVLSEEEARPAGALAGLKALLGKAD